MSLVCCVGANSHNSGTKCGSLIDRTNDVLPTERLPQIQSCRERLPMPKIAFPPPLTGCQAFLGIEL